MDRFDKKTVEAAQVIGGRAIGGQVGVGSETVPADLNALKGELERHTSRLRELVYRASDLGDSVFGSRAINTVEAKQQDTVQSAPLATQIEELGRVVSRLESALSRF